jgi:alpha-beta hydrolase superfamily lysophospholipase
MNEPIHLTTADGVTIAGDYYEGGSDRAVLLLHMMPATRASWAAFAHVLTEAGFSAFAIDLRGHGESTIGLNGVPLDYKNFLPSDHQASIHDVEAAIQWLVSEKKMKHLAIVGASIGANLAVVSGAKHHEIESMVLLSPGLDYHGVNAGLAVPDLTASQRLFVLASKDDEYAAASSEELFRTAPVAVKKIEIFQDAGHGTTMLERKPEYLQLLAAWLGEH